MHTVCSSAIVSKLHQTVLFQLFTVSNGRFCSIRLPKRWDNKSEQSLHWISIFNRWKTVLSNLDACRKAVFNSTMEIPACKSLFSPEVVLLLSQLPWTCPLHLHSGVSTINTMEPEKSYELTQNHLFDVVLNCWSDRQEPQVYFLLLLIPLLTE